MFSVVCAVVLCVGENLFLCKILCASVDALPYKIACTGFWVGWLSRGLAASRGLPHAFWEKPDDNWYQSIICFGVGNNVVLDNTVCFIFQRKLEVKLGSTNQFVDDWLCSFGMKLSYKSVVVYFEESHNDRSQHAKRVNKG